MTGPNALPLGYPPPFPVVKYLTRIPGRTPQWKAHTDVGRAKGAAAGRPNAEVWESTPNATWLRII